MFDMQRLSKAFATKSGFHVYAERFQLWRLCSHAACRRAQACRNQLGCHGRFAAWAEAARDAVQCDGGFNPEADAMRFELAERIRRMVQTEKDQTDQSEKAVAAPAQMRTAVRNALAPSCVMPGLDPGIHAVTAQRVERERNRLPGQARQ